MHVRPAAAAGLWTLFGFRIAYIVHTVCIDQSAGNSALGMSWGANAFYDQK